MVSFAKALDPDGRQIGIRASFKKDRAAVVDPRRTLTFTLDREAGKMLLADDVEVVGNCREAVIDVMWRVYQRGVQSISCAGLLDEGWERHRIPAWIVDNTLGAMFGDHQIVRPRRGHYDLAPALIQRLRVIVWWKIIQRDLNEREVSEIPDEVPTGKPGKMKFPRENHLEVSRPVLGTPSGLTNCSIRRLSMPVNPSPPLLSIATAPCVVAQTVAQTHEQNWEQISLVLL